MTLVRTSLLNGIAVAIRMASMLVLSKLFAVYVGPAGYAVIGGFQNAISVVTAFAANVLGTGVTKYTADYWDDETRRRSLWSTAGRLTLAGSVVVALGVAVFREPLARYFLNDAGLASVFLWLAGGLVLVGLNNLLLAILNGRKEVRAYVAAGVAGSLISLALAGVLAAWLGLYGALIALSLNQSVLFFVTLAICLRKDWFSLGILFGPIDRTSLRQLAGYGLMAATSAIVLPLSLVLVRNHLGAAFGWEYAGYWDAMWKLSTLGLTLVTTTLALYYLPRIAEIRDAAELRREIAHAYRVVMPVVILSSFMIYLLRDPVIMLLFTSEFAPMRDLFAWQMAGDVVKIAAWLIAYVMIGKAMIRSFIITEIIFAALFYILTLWFTSRFGFTGVAIAHLACYLLYLPTVAILVLLRGNLPGAAGSVAAEASDSGAVA